MPDINNSIVYNFAIKKCECCDTTDINHGVEAEPSRTCYHCAPGDDDPNKDIMLCRKCAERHHEEWDEKWADYYSGLL